MSSYFVDGLARAGGAHAVHDRSRCPPGCFAPEHQPQYLGEFIDTAQAVCVARLRYPHVQGCPCCGAEEALLHWVARPLSSGWFQLQT